MKTGQRASPYLMTEGQGFIDERKLKPWEAE